MFAREESVRRLFPKDFRDQDRAIFEAGIALGSIAHALAGLPILAGRNVARSLSLAASRSFALQPYRKKVVIKMLAGRKRKKHQYDYEVLTPNKMDVQVVTAYGKATVTARMRYHRRLRYPIMYVERLGRR